MLKRIFNRDRWPEWTIAGVVLLFALFFSVRELAIAGALGFPLDDSWIHLVFARNTAHGDFFAFNPHQPVSGSTSPLWTLLVAAGFFVWSNPVLMPKALGVLLNVAVGLAAFRIAQRIEVRRFPALMIALLTIGATRIVWASVSGMEVSLYVLLSLLTLESYLRYAADRSWKFFIPWVLAGVAVWSRPELALQPVFFVIHQWILRLQGRRGGVRAPGDRSVDVAPWGRLVAGVVASGIAMVPYFALNKWLSKGMLPLTFSAKSSQGVQGLIVSEDYYEIVRRSVVSMYETSWNALQDLWLPDNAFVATAAAIGIGMLIVAAVRGRLRGAQASALVLIGLQLFFYAPVRSVVTGNLDFGQYGRYAAHTTAWMMLFGSVMVVSWIGTRVKSPSTSRVVFFSTAVFGTIFLALYYGFHEMGHQSIMMGWDVSFLHQGDVQYVVIFALWAAAVAVLGMQLAKGTMRPELVQGLVLLQLFGFTIVENLQTADEYAWNVKNINDTQVLIGRWLRDRVPPGTTYATNDIGAMAYFADRDTIIDMVGLVQPEVQRALHESDFSERANLWTLKNWNITYVVCFDEWYPTLTRAGRRAGALELIRAVPIQHNITCGGRGISAMNIYAVHRDRLDSIPPESLR